VMTAWIVVMVTGPARLSRTQAKQVQEGPEEPIMEPVLGV
jgi:hypothetical protein